MEKIKTEKEQIKELKQYFKQVHKCKSKECGKIYGSDARKDSGFCPNCNWLKRMSKHKSKYRKWIDD